MGYWEFNKSDPSSVRMEVTQGDQFNNDDVGLAEALVREAIQNSSDVPAGAGPVKVRFAIRDVSGSVAKAMNAQLAGLRPHLDACGIDSSVIDADGFRVLAIEDFNTKGLTGSHVEVDKGNFDRFWRAVGDSGKKGKEGGRWGLGKLVYSSASAVKVFYGLSITRDNPSPCLMGQAVLENHRIGNSFYPAHGFYFESRSEPLNLQQPIHSSSEIQSFRNLGGLTRTDQTGLSLIVPWLVDGIDEESIISGVISNYYFPILAGRLIVEVGDVVISKATFLETAAAHHPISHIPFDFVKQISDTIDTGATVEARRALGKAELDAGSFTAEEIAAMKTRFASGELVRVRAPVVLKPKDDRDVPSFIDLYLRSLPEDAKPFALIARGPITLPGERRHFGSAPVYGALIANDDAVADFLGDAENPAHTAWNPRAKKLAARWRSPSDTLAAIRHSLRQFYALIAEQAESEDSEALIDFFSILDQNQATKGKKRKPPKPLRPDIPQRERAISIRPRKGGFDIVPGPAAASWSYPRTIRVRVAYDMIGANPFKRHSPFDFDLAKDDEIEIETTDASYEAVKANILKVTAESQNFRLEFSGFDERRDIVVDARTQ
jgi:hypothetical protein